MYQHNSNTIGSSTLQYNSVTILDTDYLFLFSLLLTRAFQWTSASVPNLLLTRDLGSRLILGLLTLIHILRPSTLTVVP